MKDKIFKYICIILLSIIIILLIVIIVKINSLQETIDIAKNLIITATKENSTITLKEIYNELINVIERVLGFNYISDESLYIEKSKNMQIIRDETETENRLWNWNITKKLFIIWFILLHKIISFILIFFLENRKVDQ